MAMYKHARTRIRSYGRSVSEWFGMNVGVHQGSVLSQCWSKRKKERI